MHRSAHAHAPLRWADALGSLGQALQLLAAACEWRHGRRATPGSLMLGRAARAVFERGVTLGIWQSAWQHWNVAPPPALPDALHAPVGWVERSQPQFPHAAAAVLESHWRTIRDEVLSWHCSMQSTPAGAGGVHGGGASGGDADAHGCHGSATPPAAFELASGEDDETLLHHGQWRILRFLHPASEGWINASVAAAPRTAEVLRAIPALRDCAAAGCTELTAQLSHLAAGSHIAPHCGRGRITLMLPLIAPPGCCRLQVDPCTCTCSCSCTCTCTSTSTSACTCTCTCPYTIHMSLVVRSWTAGGPGRAAQPRRRTSARIRRQLGAPGVGRHRSDGTHRGCAALANKGRGRLYGGTWRSMPALEGRAKCRAPCWCCSGGGSMAMAVGEGQQTGPQPSDGPLAAQGSA